MTVYTATRTTRQPSDRPTWLQRWLGNLPGGDEVSPIEVLRAEFHTALANERAERQQVASDLATVRTAAAATEKDLQATRDELARSRDYGRQQANHITELNSTIRSINAASERLTVEFSGLSSANGELQEALRRLEADHKIDQETIALLRERLHTMETEIATLRDERQKNIGQIAGLELARMDLQRRLDTAYTRLKEAGLSAEGLT